MISGKDIYNIFAAIVPLYVTMLLGYASVKWWKIFTPDQCSGINRFIVVFVVPLLTFHIIATSNPYQMNLLFIAGDSLQKVVILIALFLWQTFSKKSIIEWTITLFTLSTLPNNLFIGIPLMTAMYGDMSESLMIQVVVLQGIVWYNVSLCLFEIRAAKLLIAEQFPETAGSIASFKVESDVVSLSGHEPIQADAEIGDDGKLHVVLRRSSSISSYSASHFSNSYNYSIPHASNLNGVEIYSVQSSRELRPYLSRGSSLSQMDLHPTFEYKGTTKPWPSDFENKRRARSINGETFNGGQFPPYPSPDLMRFGSTGGFPRTTVSVNGGGEKVGNEDLHMFVWSTASSPVSEVNNTHSLNRAASTGVIDFSDTVAIKHHSTASRDENMSQARNINGDEELDIEEGAKLRASRSHQKQHQMPPASVLTRLVFIMVWRKLIRNPSTYGSVLGLVWSFIAGSRLHIKLPSIVDGSITMLSSGGIGLVMFSLGLFMALQPKLIACGKSMVALSMAVRFLVGPAVIAATSAAIGVHGVLLKVLIVQAALPLAIVPFVYAKEYNVHPEIISTSVIFGLLIAVPVTIIYYILLGL